MLRFLFPRLTAEPGRGAPLFAAVTAEARKPRWYAAGQVPDSLNGRFAMLSTVAALVIVRLENLGDDHLSVALTERFVEVMESEHRELGIGDPTLGKTVRKLVGMLARRVELWREAIGKDEWAGAARDSLYGANEVKEPELEYSIGELRGLWARLQSLSAEALAKGRLE